ncbi:Asp23/Gls24 family envelope stress response protein [Ruania halotolerans]|uniref:Asp23/Gls24 family envelope stress response protein n=1 Tax=Ruania halotolerans TaxID=2897773 RepID=UPI001E30FB9E|nr:Asp23/Gls24 family envelope stress response protein [Ruania halotolerans]UFU06676.1 Asp23/Gls24 family envelope stress response protein [Ruania halotolerans]
MAEKSAPAHQTATTGMSSDVAKPTGPLDTELGTTTIADTVVSKIAGIAARDVTGVYDIGGGAARAFSAIRERIPGGSTNYSQGVRVEVGTVECAVDVEFIAEYGVAIADVAQSVRDNIASSIQRMTGLTVVEVNIAVTDVHLPGDENEDEGEDRTQPAEPRVQ